MRNRIPGRKYAARQPWAQAALQEIPPICRWAGDDEVVIRPESQSRLRSWDPSGSSTMWGFSQQALGRAAKPRGFAGKLRSDAPVPEKKGGRRARSGPAAGTQHSKGKPEHPVGVRKGAQQGIKHLVARARRKEGECAQQRQVRDGGSRVKASTAPEGNTCKRKSPGAVGGDSRSTAGHSVRKWRGPIGQAPTTARQIGAEMR